MKKRKSSTVTNATKSEARRQEGGENAIDRGEQRKSRSKGKRSYLDAEREMEQVGNHVLPRRDMHGRIRTELINAGEY